MRGESGTITIWMLGLCVAILFLGGLSLDLWRAFSERRALAGIAEAAAIAGASALDEAAYRAGLGVRLDPPRARALAAASLAVQTDVRSLAQPSEVAATPDAVTVVVRGEVELTLLRVLLPRLEPLPIAVVATAEPRPA